MLISFERLKTGLQY